MNYTPSGSGPTIQRQDYAKQIIFHLKDFWQTGHLLQLVTIPPHMKQRIHVHRIQTEVYYALEGEALLYVNGEEQLVKPGDACIIEPGDHHRYWNISDTGFKQVVFKIDMPDDTEWLE